MSIQNFDIKPEFYKQAHDTGINQLIPQISKLFSYAAMNRVAEKVENLLDLGEMAVQDELFLFSDAWAEATDDMHRAQNDVLFELFLRFPRVIPTFLGKKFRTKFLSLPSQTQTELIYAGYKAYASEIDEDEAFFSSEQNHYKAFQTINGDVILNIYEFSKQRGLFEATEMIRWPEQERSASVYMYQETTTLLEGLCMLYTRLGLPAEHLRSKVEELNSVQTLTPNAADVDRSDLTVRLALQLIFEREHRHFDFSGVHQHVGLGIQAGVYDQNSHTLLTIADKNSLGVIVSSDQ
ncbi:MAG: hypothetical protein ACOYN2_02650 [Patescibacteria group bacterium]